MPNTQAGGATGNAVQNPPNFPGQIPYVSTGGGVNSLQAAAASANQIKTGEGKLCRVVVTATGTAAASFYDNTSATGQPIFVVPANAATGTIYDVQLVFTTGLYYGGGANTPQLTVSYD